MGATTHHLKKYQCGSQKQLLKFVVKNSSDIHEEKF